MSLYRTLREILYLYAVQHFSGSDVTYLESQKAVHIHVTQTLIAIDGKGSHGGAEWPDLFDNSMGTGIGNSKRGRAKTREIYV